SQPQLDEHWASGSSTAFVPGYSDGLAPDSHRLPADRAARLRRPTRPPTEAAGGSPSFSNVSGFYRSRTAGVKSNCVWLPWPGGCFFALALGAGGNARQVENRVLYAAGVTRAPRPAPGPPRIKHRARPTGWKPARVRSHGLPMAGPGG